MSDKESARSIGPAEAGPEARRETQQTPDRNSEHCRARRCRHRPDSAGAAGPPARSGSLNDVTAHYGILLALYALMQFACAPVLGALWIVSGGGRSCSSRWPALLSTTPSWRRRLPSGSLYRADRGRHHRGDWAVAGAYIADITDGDERARHFGFMSACFGFGWSRDLCSVG